MPKIADKMSDPKTYRKPHSSEKQLLTRLMENHFSGRDEIATRLKTCLVKTIDENGCLEFPVISEVQASAEQRVPAEAEALD